MTMAGFFADATDFWAGGTSTSNPSTKGDASVRLDAANGRIYSDSIYQIIYAAESIAEFGSGNEADGIFNDSWSYTFSGGGSGGQRTILEKRYIKRFGITKVTMTGFFEVTSFSGNGESATVIVATEGQSASYTIDTVTGDNFEITVDLPAATSGPTEVAVYVEGDPGGTSGTDAVTCELREDILIIGTT
jgi:hypothetical protein